MIKRTLRYLWGKKSMILILVLVVLLLPDAISRDLQVRDTTIVTNLTIDATQPTWQVTAEKLKSSPGAKSAEYDTAVYQGTNIREILQNVSLAHCTNIDFVGDPDLTILRDLYNYQDLRANTKINHDQTLDDILKNLGYCCPQSSASTN